MAQLSAVVLIAAGLVMALPGAASAAPTPCLRAGGEYRAWCADVTGLGAGSTLRLERDTNYGNGTVPGAGYQDGDSLALDCWTRGSGDEGGHGDTYWFLVFDPDDHAVEGYVNDDNLTTGRPSDWKPVVEQCPAPPIDTSGVYRCRRAGGEYRSWCADVTGLAHRGSLELQKKPDYAHGRVSGPVYSSGDQLALSCWTTGPGDAGGHGDTYWFEVFDPNDTSIDGYVNDYNLSTGSPSNWKSVVDRCASTPPSPPAHQPQLRGDHADAQPAAALADRLGHISLASAVRDQLESLPPFMPVTTDLGTCAYQLFRGNVMPPGNVVSDGFCWNGTDESKSSGWSDGQGTTRLNWFPQGLSSSGDAVQGGVFQGHRYLAVSWHGRGNGQDNYRSRVTFVNLDGGGPSAYRRYLHVLLVAPSSGGTACTPLQLHAGGLVWYGTKLLVADDVDHGIRVFDLNDLARASSARGCGGGNYRYVLPQVATYLPTVPKNEAMRLNAMSLDRDGGTPSLVVGENAPHNTTYTRVARYRLSSSTHMLAEAGHGVAAAVASHRTGILGIQGVLIHDGLYYFSTSKDGGGHGCLVTWDGNASHAKHSYTWSKGGEAIAYWDGFLWSLTELEDWAGGHKIVFKMAPSSVPRMRTGC